MSHTTTVSAIDITDIAALTAAVNDLNKQGIKCVLQENVVPRGYFKNQFSKAPYCIKMENSRYDIGLYKESGSKAYKIKCDFYGGFIEKVLGVTREEGVSPDQCRVGKLYNAYTVNKLRNTILSSGRVANITYADNGSVQIVTGGN